MVKATLAIVVLALLSHASAQQKRSDPLQLMNLWMSVPSDDDIKSAPIAKGENILQNGPCGETFVYSKKGDGSTSVRVTNNGQRFVIVAFCWLDEVRSRFNAEEKEADGPDTVAFIRTLELELTSDPKSYYNRLKNTYCGDGGTFFMDLTNQVRECSKLN
jgi:hypothetical protein